MANGKRRALTTDELMRIQERPRRKRVRLSPTPTTDLDSEADELSVREEERSLCDTDEDGVQDSDASDSDSELKHLAKLNPRQQLDTSRIEIKSRATNLHPSSSQWIKPLPASFSSLGVSPSLQASLASMSIRTPTEVQAACIPPLIAGKSD
jgi:ATP-dependent RNA helicase DDX49/DBP8